MADKVNKEESVARVYQFLNKQKDWKTTADKNGDGTIIKTEFRAYLLGSGFKFNNGENKEDLIDAFWKAIDSKTSGKIGKGSAINNKNALDSAEIEHVEKSLEATKKIITFMQDKEAPSELDEQYRTAWKNSVKQGLIYKASEFLKTGTVEEINDEWLNGVYKLSSAKATADYTAADQIKKELGHVEGYAIGDDKDLKGVIDEYVGQLEENPKDDATIINDIKQIVAAYVDTAKTNSKASTDLLAKYGYDPDGYLNDLQVAVLKNKMTSEILEHIKSNYPDIYADEYKAEIESTVKKFVENYLSDKGANEFTSLQEFDISAFATSTEFNDLKTKIETEIREIQTARDNLNTYISRILAENDTEKNAIVLEVIGSTEATEITNKLLALKTVADIQAKQTELETKINELARTRAAKEEADKAAQEAKLANISNDNDPITIDGKTYSIATILSSGRPVAYELCYDLKWDDQNVVEVAAGRIENFLNQLVSALKANGYPSAALEKAKNTTNSFYVELIRASKEQDDDNDGTKSVFFSYYDAKEGKNTTATATFGYNADYGLSDIDSLDEIGNAGDSGYYLGCNRERWARDQYCLHLDLRVVMQKFISFLG